MYLKDGPTASAQVPWKGLSLASSLTFYTCACQPSKASCIPTSAQGKVLGLKVSSSRSQAGTAALMSGLGQDRNLCPAESSQASMLYKTAWDRAHSFIMSRWQCLGEQLTGQQRLVPVLLLSYSTRLLGVSQPSSSALQAAWHQAGLSGGTILFSR